MVNTNANAKLIPRDTSKLVIEVDELIASCIQRLRLNTGIKYSVFPELDNTPWNVGNVEIKFPIVTAVNIKEHVLFACLIVLDEVEINKQTLVIEKAPNNTHTNNVMYVTKL